GRECRRERQTARRSTRAIATIAAPRAARSIPGKRCERNLSLLDIDFYSDVLGRNQRMEVILPPGPAPEGGFPTLYLLHGMTDDCTIWLRRSSIERYADARKLAV